MVITEHRPDDVESARAISYFRIVPRILYLLKGTMYQSGWWKSKRGVLHTVDDLGDLQVAL